MACARETVHDGSLKSALWNRLHVILAACSRHRTRVCVWGGGGALALSWAAAVGPRGAESASWNPGAKYKVLIVIRTKWQGRAVAAGASPGRNFEGYVASGHTSMRQYCAAGSSRAGARVPPYTRPPRF